MAQDYPDIIGEYIFAPQRFEVDGLQYVGVFEPPAIKAGEVTQLHLYLQSALDVPLKVAIKLSLPQSGRFRGHPLLTTKETEIELELEQAEVGQLIIPFTTTDKLTDGQHTVELEVKVQHSKGADIRKSRTSQVKIPLLDDLVGLNLVGVLGAQYQTKNGKKSGFKLTLSKEPGESNHEVSLESHYQQLWNLELAELMQQAQEEVNKGRIKIIDDLKIEPLFVALYAENVERFADVGLPLRVGEAIAIGKLLTYTTHFFLGQGQGPVQDSLLCPIWERALANEYSTANTIDVVKYAGYKHILRLATALSFGMIAETAGKHLWSQQERREVINFIANALDSGNPIPPDFLYLPLMIGALKVVTKVRLPDEDIRHTIRLIQKARQERPDVLGDEDLRKADQVFNHILKQMMSGVKA